MLAQKGHEIQVAAETTAKEVDPRGQEMKRLSDLVWHGDPPYAQKVDRDQAEQMFELLLQSPNGLMTLMQKFGQHKVQEIKQELIKQGKLPPDAMNPEV